MGKQTAFNESPYLTQARRLRLLAEKSLELYPIKVKNIIFIKYSANAIFKVIDNQDKSHLLRVHPPGYHTHDAIQEEIKWLHHINQTSDIMVPKPFTTKCGDHLVKCSHSLISTPRFCVMFEWIPGKTRWKSINHDYVACKSQ